MVDWMEYERLAHILWKVYLMSPQETINMNLHYVWSEDQIDKVIDNYWTVMAYHRVHDLSIYKYYSDLVSYNVHTILYRIHW